MTYCTTTELVALSGSTLDATTILTPIIEAADREIDAYLAPHNISGAASGACKQASLKLSMAGLLERGLHTLTYQASVGNDYASNMDVIRAIESNRKRAFVLLDQYVKENKSESIFVRRVDGI